jgi:nucleotide-binding universal stress UspA family protein
VERVIHLSPVPVFLARGLPAQAPRTILVAVDDSTAAEQALLWTRFLSQRFGARVIVYHALVMAGPYASPHYPIELDARKAEREALEQAREWLTGRIRKADLDPEEVEIDVTVGEPRREVPAAAERHGAELVVTGSRGAGAIRRALLGSVASAVLRRTAVPVLVVPGPGQP